jgi:hypothetical protein
MSGYDILANQAVSLISSLLIKGGESFAEKYGEKIAESLSDKTNKLFSIIKRKFDGNEDDKIDLENFQRKPERYSGQIKQILEEKMNQDKAFASEVSTTTKEIRGLIVNISIENSQAKNITGIESNRNEGNFSATIKNSTATEDLVGGKFNSI